MPIPPRVPLACLEAQIIDLSSRCICCWGDTSTLSEFWERVTRAFNGTPNRSILKITRVIQMNCAVRFDLYFRVGKYEYVRSRMQRFANRWGWYLRKHIPHDERNNITHTTLSPQLSTRSRIDRLHLASLNVNGLRSKAKVVDVAALLEMECLDVVLLQETLIRATDLRPKFQGYRDFFAYGDQVASERGCCIIVKDTLRARTVGNSSPCWISVRLEDEDVAKSTIFVSVYMPSGRQGEPYRNNLRAELRRLLESFPNDRLVVGGDWNLDEDGICDLLSEWDIDIPGVHTLWPIDSSSRTRGTCMRGRGRVIDHIVAWPGDGFPPHSLRVDYSWDISDHFPIFATVPCDSGITTPTINTRCSKRLVSKKIPLPGEDEDESEWPEAFKKFVNANRFEILSNLDGEDVSGFDIDSKANCFVNAVWEVAKDVDAVVEHKSRKPRPALQRSILQCIRQRRRAFMRCRETQGGDVHEVMAIYIKMRKRVKIVIRRNRRRAEQRNIEKAVRNFKIVGRRAFWKWAKSLRKDTPQLASEGEHPIRNPSTGDLCSNPSEVNECWMKHYEALANDPHPSNTREQIYIDRCMETTV